MGRLSRLIPPHGVEMLRAAARGAGLDFEPVPVRAWFDGAAFIALVRALGGSVVLTEQFGGWIAGVPGRPWPLHFRAFAQELSVGRGWIDDFEGAVLVQVDGSTFVAVRTDVVVSPPWVAPALIIGAPSLEKALSLIDRLEARQEELTAGRVQTFGTSLVWLDVTPTPEVPLPPPLQLEVDPLELLRQERQPER